MLATLALCVLVWRIGPWSGGLGGRRATPVQDDAADDAAAMRAAASLRMAAARATQVRSAAQQAAAAAAEARMALPKRKAGRERKGVNAMTRFADAAAGRRRDEQGGAEDRDEQDAASSDEGDNDNAAAASSDEGDNDIGADEGDNDIGASSASPAAAASSDEGDNDIGASSASPASSSGRRSSRPPKEQVNALTKADLLRVLKQLYVPRTTGWREAGISRTIVHKAQPSNKYLSPSRAHAQGVLDALPDADVAAGAHKRCAVVGNSGVLLQREDGAAIDGHDAVFRFNDGPTEAFEKYAGSRTTYRFLNNNWSRSWLKHRARGAREDNIVLFGMGAARFIEGLHARYPSTPVLFVAPEFAGNARGMYKKSYLIMEEANMLSVRGRNSPPTGVEGVFLAIQACDEVNVYGFATTPNPEVPYHYHDKVRGVEAAHSFTFQAIFLRMIAASGRFRLCVPGEEAYASGECVRVASSRPARR